jgi:hypothetical protein
MVLLKKMKNEISENTIYVENLTIALLRNKFIRPKCGLAPSETLNLACI